MGNRQVLVVDGLSETEQVLKAVLEPRGLLVDRVRGHAGRTPRSGRPCVVVLHEDSADVPADEVWDDVPRIVIGTAGIPDPAECEANGEYLSHPFHYGELIRAIERALDRGSTK